MICIMCLAQMRQSRTPSNHHVCLQRMGGYRRVATALELEYLPPKRGRGASAPWSPDRADSELALVQFTQRGADISTTYSSSSSRSIVAQPKPLVASRRFAAPAAFGFALKCCGSQQQVSCWEASQAHRS